MYRMFCVSVRNYLDINKYAENGDDFRMRIVRPILVLSDIRKYKETGINDKSLFQEVNHLIYEISVRSEEFHSFQAFSWELDGYGFEAEKCLVVSDEVLFEQLKLIDLLLSCHYWYAAS